jgi:protein Tex
MKNTNFEPAPKIAQELQLPEPSVRAVIQLLSEGGTIPFIARYRKEMTGSLDEVQIRNIEERRGYLSELEDRRKTIIQSVDEQKKLTDTLRRAILACTSKSALEDLYLPYKPKRRTRATIAREKGLEPLAQMILEQTKNTRPEIEAQRFINNEKGVQSVDDALKAARDIVAETVSENAELRKALRRIFHQNGHLITRAVPNKTKSPTKFEQYYDFSEPVCTIPSHRFLAIRRGEREGVLRVRLGVDDDQTIARMSSMLGVRPRNPWGALYQEALEDGYRRLLTPSLETDIRVDLKLGSDKAAVDIFANNLRSLLLAAPLGAKAIIGIDPGLRTGCKCVALDATGTFLENMTIYLTKGAKAQAEARATFGAFVQRHEPTVIAVGNGTGNRETETFVRELLKEMKRTNIPVVQVNEAGASIYSASDIAREEFPSLDLTVRGAISIGRRLQDPLAELVKLDPKSIGVGQYQHDVHQPLLGRKLSEVVESCVNHVGVSLNTASAPLLSYVAGIGPALAKKIVKHRQQNGAFKSRKALLKVSGLGPKAYVQAAGFLKVHGGVNPLDSSAVHPESYGIVQQMALGLSLSVEDLIGQATHIGKINIRDYVTDVVGEPTLVDILKEVQKPGRDPRATFEPPKFRDDVTTLGDLKEGMRFEGIVTNVTAFGAFVDIGVHQDGLVHISQLADRFVKNPADVVKAGEKLKVRVLTIDLERKRISLSARTEESTTIEQPQKNIAKKRASQARPHKSKRKPPEQDEHKKGALSHTPFSDLFRK